MARTTLLLLSILFLLPVNASVKKLQVEYLTNPIGLDITVPRFSWQLESAERGVKQIAYQITVATDAACSNTVWTSGKVASDKSLNICYAGPALAPSTRYYGTIKPVKKPQQKRLFSKQDYYPTDGREHNGSKLLK